MFGADSGLDPHELRRRAKIVNYALLYGKTAFTLAKDIGVTQEAAQEFIDAYFAGFPRVRAFIDQTLEEARADRRRARRCSAGGGWCPKLTSRNGQMRGRAERDAVNMPIQGTAADILKRAMIDVPRRLPRRGCRARMILTVHDELLFEVPRGGRRGRRRSCASGWRARCQLTRAADRGRGDRRELARGRRRHSAGGSSYFHCSLHYELPLAPVKRRIPRSCAFA